MVPGTRADLAEADWVSDELKNKPHVTLGCGHLSRPGSGPLAEAGYGYCRYHGVTRIVPEPHPGNGSIADEEKATAVAGGTAGSPGEEPGRSRAGTSASSPRRSSPGAAITSAMAAQHQPGNRDPGHRAGRAREPLRLLGRDGRRSLTSAGETSVHRRRRRPNTPAPGTASGPAR